MTTLPKIELKNVKHAEFASEETHCYQATVWVDGKRFCTVSNDGHGGADMQHPLKGGNYAELRPELEKLDKLIAKTFPAKVYTEAEHGFDGDFTEDLESVCCNLVTQWLIARDMKRALRNNMIFKKKDKDGLYEIKIGRKGPLHRQGLFDKYNKADDIEAVLNTLPEAEAVKLWQAVGT